MLLQLESFAKEVQGVITITVRQMGIVFGWTRSDVLGLDLATFLDELDALLETKHNQFIESIVLVEAGVGRALSRAFGKKPSPLPSYSKEGLSDYSDEELWWRRADGLGGEAAQVDVE